VPGLEERGVDRNLLAFLYNTALATARYDDNGHLLPSHVGLTECMRYATTPSPACGALTPAPASLATTQRRTGLARPSRPAAPATPATAAAPATRAHEEAPAAALPSPGAPAPTEPAVEGLLDFLLG
jgi:hypothetical protein